MDAVFDSVALRALVKRIWCFACGLTQDEPLAEAMVADAFGVGFALGRRYTERETFVRMLAAAHAVFRNGCGGDRHERSHCATVAEPPASLEHNGRGRALHVHERILSEFHLLSAEERALLLLAEVERLTYEESALVLDVPVDDTKLAYVALRLKLGR